MPHETTELRDEILTHALELYCAAGHVEWFETDVRTFQSCLFGAAVNFVYPMLAAQHRWTFNYHSDEFTVVITAEPTQETVAAGAQLTGHAWALLQKVDLLSLMPKLG